MKDQMGVRISDALTEEGRDEAGFPSAVCDPMFNPSALKETFEALQHAQQDLQRAHDYTRAIIETVPPLLVLDADLRVKEANESFYKHFRVSRSQTEDCLVYELGNGQWNIPKLRTFLEEVLPRHSFFKDFEVTHQFENIGLRTVLVRWPAGGPSREDTAVPR